MKIEKDFMPYNQLLNEIDRLRDDQPTAEREVLISYLKELVEISYNALGLNTAIDDGPDSSKWVVITTKGENKGMTIYSDMRQVSNHIQMSESTMKRRIKELGETFQINGYIISKSPYYKSKRGNG